MTARTDAHICFFEKFAIKAKPHGSDGADARPALCGALSSEGECGVRTRFAYAQSFSRCSCPEAAPALIVSIFLRRNLLQTDRNCIFVT